MALLASLSRTTLSSIKPARRRALVHRALGSNAKQGRTSRTRNPRTMCSTYKEDLEREMSDVYASVQKMAEEYGSPVEVSDRLRSAIVERDAFASDDEAQQVQIKLIEDKTSIEVSKQALQVFMIGALEPYLPTEGGKVLDVSKGSGYSAACFRNLAGKNARVVAVLPKSEKYEFAEFCLTSWNRSALKESVTLLQGNLMEGNFFYEVKKVGPYDVIQIGAVVDILQSIPKLLDLLKPGGAMLVSHARISTDKEPEKKTRTVPDKSKETPQLMVLYKKQRTGLVLAEQVAVTDGAFQPLATF